MPKQDFSNFFQSGDLKEKNKKLKEKKKKKGQAAQEPEVTSSQWFAGKSQYSIVSGGLLAHVIKFDFFASFRIGESGSSSSIFCQSSFVRSG